MSKKKPPSRSNSPASAPPEVETEFVPPAVSQAEITDGDEAGLDSAESVVRKDLPIRRIAIIEDNVDSAHLLGLLLRRLGHQVDAFHDALTGIEGVLVVRPEVVLIDIGLPQIDGFEVARRLRRQFPSDELTLIALTGYNSDEDRQRARDAGFDRYLTKPVSLADLRSALNS
jgi:CheY-like chemotaxis protein